MPRAKIEVDLVCHRTETNKIHIEKFQTNHLVIVPLQKEVLAEYDTTLALDELLDDGNAENMGCFLKDHKMSPMEIFKQIELWETNGENESPYKCFVAFENEGANSPVGFFNINPNLNIMGKSFYKADILLGSKYNNTIFSAHLLYAMKFYFTKIAAAEPESLIDGTDLICTTSDPSIARGLEIVGIQRATDTVLSFLNSQIIGEETLCHYVAGHAGTDLLADSFEIPDDF